MQPLVQAVTPQFSIIPFQGYGSCWECLVENGRYTAGKSSCNDAQWVLLCVPGGCLVWRLVSLCLLAFVTMQWCKHTLAMTMGMSISVLMGSCVLPAAVRKLTQLGTSPTTKPSRSNTSRKHRCAAQSQQVAQNNKTQLQKPMGFSVLPAAIWKPHP